jgi:hypothetical protein
MGQGLVTDRITRPSRRFMKPRLLSCASRAASSKSPERIRRKTFQIPAMITRLMIAMR